MYEKRLHWKGEVSFKIHDVTTWLTNDCNIHVAQYLKKEKKTDNKIWSVNRLWQEKHFSSKIMQKMRQGD